MHIKIAFSNQSQYERHADVWLVSDKDLLCEGGDGDQPSLPTTDYCHSPSPLHLQSNIILHGSNLNVMLAYNQLHV